MNKVIAKIVTKTAVKTAFISLLCVIGGILVGGMALKIAGISPLAAYSVMWQGAFGKPNYIAYILIRSTPLILTGLSVTFAFRTGLFNIGVEGQFIVGALCAAFLGLHLNVESFYLPSFLQIPTVLILSMLSAGLYGSLAGWFKAKWQVHEVISTIMLNWIALYLSNFFILFDGFRRPNTETSEFIQQASSLTFFEEWKTSDPGLQWLNDHPFWQEFLRPPVNAGLLFALLAAVAVWFILNKTIFGFKLKAVGYSPEAARFAGMDVSKTMTASMMISGALAGLAGATHVMGVSKNIAMLATHEGYGFDGIAVALIANNSPLAVVGSGFFMGTLKYSGQKIQPALDAPSEVIQIMIGTIIFFASMPALFELISKMFSKRFIKERKTDD